MAGLFGLSVNSTTRGRFFPDTLFRGTSYCRHLGQEWCGLAVCNNNVIKCEPREGLFQPNFEKRMSGFKGFNGVGYCGEAPEPFFVKSRKFGDFAIVFSGNIQNISALVGSLEKEGRIFQKQNDAEIFAHLLIQGKDIFDGIKLANEKIQGAWVVLILSKEGIYAARSPSGHWPLVIGQHKGEIATCVCSEQTGFINLGFKFTREVEPGEIVFLQSGQESLSERIKSSSAKKICSFYGVYTSSPAALVQGLPATWIRKQLGGRLARRDIENKIIPHIVMPVPDSGRSHAEGYFQEFCIQIMGQKISRVPLYGESLLKYGFDRSFLRPSKRQRDKTAHYKIVTTAETTDHFLRVLKRGGLGFIADDITENKRIIIVVCEDSVVRGTQIRSNLAPKIRAIFEQDGIKTEIHVRASFPPLLSHCTFGKTTKKGETLAGRVPDIVERARELGVESVTYNTISDLVRILEIGEENLCLQCTKRL